MIEITIQNFKSGLFITCSKYLRFEEVTHIDGFKIMDSAAKPFRVYVDEAAKSESAVIFVEKHYLQALRDIFLLAQTHDQQVSLSSPPNSGQIFTYKGNIAFIHSLNTEEMARLYKKLKHELLKSDE